jgi:hypothetical protein
MIQRIQTVFFTIALIFSILPFSGISLFTITLGKSEIKVDAFEFNGNGLTENHYFWILLSVASLILLLTIFSFKNRKNQIKLGWLSFVLLFVLAAWIFVSIYFDPIYAQANKELGLGIIALFLALPFVYLGIRGVKKDQALLDSLNRLR